MKLEIETVENGYILKDCSDEPIRKEVFQFKDDNDLYALVDLLYTLNEKLADSTTKYSKERIHIVILPGLDYEGELSDRSKEDIEHLKWVIPKKYLKK